MSESSIKLTAGGPLPQQMAEVDDCDVTDRDSLVQYRARRKEWLGWYELRKDEPNTIQQQIFSMIFLDLTYRILAEPRQDENRNVSAKSGLLAHLLDQGYVATQVLAIRRLLDRDSDVISVRRLLDDICKHKHLLTREIYVCYDGTPYDPNAWQSLPQTPMMQMWGIEAPGLGNYLRARFRHEKFDYLSGVSPSERKRSDLVQERVFDKLRQSLESTPAKGLIKLSNKFFAHAADVDSRGSLEYSGIQLADIAEIHRAIIRVERAITDELLYIGVARNVVPMPPLGLLKGLDDPYVTAESIPKMYERWDKLAAERDRWSQGTGDELIGTPNKPCHSIA